MLIQIHSCLSSRKMLQVQLFETLWKMNGGPRFPRHSMVAEPIKTSIEDSMEAMRPRSMMKIRWSGKVLSTWRRTKMLSLTLLFHDSMYCSRQQNDVSYDEVAGVGWRLHYNDIMYPFNTLIKVLNKFMSLFVLWHKDIVWISLSRQYCI